MEATLLYRCNDITGESATWIPATNTFMWVDIDNGILHCLDSLHNCVEDHRFPEMITSIVPSGDCNKVYIAMKNRIVLYDVVNRVFDTAVELTHLTPALRTNDCKSSPEGRMWCGILHMKNHVKTGSLCVIDHDGRVSTVLAEQNIPNGIVWSKDGTLMFYADSGRGCIEEFAYDQATGTVSPTGHVINVPEEYGIPDGMTIDDNGNLWAAHWGGFGVYVWDVKTGKLIDKVEVPVPNAASCTFGGENGDELYITTARDGLSQEELERFPLSGSLFVAHVDSVKPGVNHYEFRLKNSI